MSMKIISVVGARPNFMKIAPFIEAVEAWNTRETAKIEHILVHTGQHYDDRMSKAFFESLNIPEATINLGIGSGTHAEQVGLTMIAFEKVLMEEKPDWVVVLGDVNATLACSVTAKKLHIKVCHIEAGLRSGDMHMPEEINRLVTDRLSDLLLTPDRIAVENLKKEGIAGNIMIDTLEKHRAKSTAISIQDIIDANSIQPVKTAIADSGEDYALVTLHRPSNVDHEPIISSLISFLLNEVTRDMKIVWAVHPRTQKQLQQFGLWDSMLENDRLLLLHPLNYHDMLRMNMGARIMLTDSGGLQEECTVLGTPCLTMRWNTERPVTLSEHGGVSVLVGNNVERIRSEYRQTIMKKTSPVFPELWDGRTAERCLKALIGFENSAGA
jgi:UDP-N-acetylglucosamine 2-epimerase (non-hydrolysing)